MAVFLKGALILLPRTYFLEYQVNFQYFSKDVLLF